jgi:hypothetical protein
LRNFLSEKNSTLIFRLTAMNDDIAALRAALWANGYRPVAVMTRTKRPAEGLIAVDWANKARRNPPYDVANAPSPGATSTGILADGLRAIDIDIDDAALADQIEAAANQTLGDAPVRFRAGSAKRLILYRATEGEPKKRSVKSSAATIEALGYGQKFVSYGVHPEGMPYEWREGRDPRTIPRDSLTPISEDQLGAFLDTAAQLIGAPTEAEREAAKAHIEPAGTAPIIVPENSARGTAYGEKALNDICAELASITKGGRNDALNNAAMRLGGMAARGWVQTYPAQQALIEACRANGLVKDDGANSVRATINSGWRAGLRNPARDPVDRPLAQAAAAVVAPNLYAKREDGSYYDEATGEIMDTPAPDQKAPGLSDDMTRPPGLVGDITDWICASARQPSRPLALAAALVTVGTLAGRRWAGPTRSATHLYVMSLAPTSGGKQHPQNCVETLLRAAGKPEYFGAPSYMSMSAVIQELRNKPVMVSCVDEYGAFLKRVNSKGAGGHERGISEVMRNLWGLSFKSYRTPAWAQLSSQDVGVVCFSILGSSTPGELMSALSGDDVTNGFLNRFLVIDGGERKPSREPEMDAKMVPSGISERLRAIPHGPDVLGIGPNPDPEIVPWGAGAQDLFDGLCEECLALVDSGEEGLYFARTSEIAVRIATIVALGVNPHAPVISDEIMDWSGKLALHCGKWLAGEAEAHITEELGAARLSKRVEVLLSKGPLSYRDIHRLAYRNVRNANDLKMVLDNMEAAGVIKAFMAKNMKNGKVFKTFSLT